MKYQKLLIAILLILSFCNLLKSQNLTQTIKGNIVDKESQITLPGANIVVLGTNPVLGAVSDENGEFRITEVPVGRYNLQVSYIGYEPVIMPEVLVNSGKEVVLNLSMVESVTKMSEIEIRADIRKDKPINSMATVSARTFSVEETRRYAGGLDDPARMASAFAGVTTGNIQDNAIIIRGNAPKGVLWRLEGVEIPNPNHFAGGNIAGGGAVTVFSGQLLSNSDFFTGAFPAEYGNALAGVFDMKLRNGNNETREYAFQLGTLGIDFAAEGPFKKGKKASYLFNYRYSTLSLLQYIMPEMEQIPVYQDLSFKFNFPTEKAGIFSLWGIGALDENSEPTDEDSTKWEYEWDRIYYDWNLKIGAIGLSHKILAGKNSYLNSSLVASVTSNVMEMSRINNEYVLDDNFYGNSLTGKYTFSTFLNHKFNAKHTNRTGIIIDNLSYKIDLQTVPHLLPPMVQIVDQKGNTILVQVYSQSRYNFTKKFSLNLGIHSQYFAQNNHYAVEPRAGLRWNFLPTHTLTFGYGNHSQIEPLKIYFAQIKVDNELAYPNKDLDFSKAHHFVLGYDKRVTENLRVKIEPYFQYLYNVPVIKDSSYSMINFEQDWAFSQSLVNDGTGRNIGIDFTIERFFNKKYYYLLTASIFDSKYTGGDGKEYNSRFDKGFVLTTLAGKEFQIGKDGKNNILGFNGRLTVMGGSRMSPLDEEMSLIKEEVVYDNTRAFEDTKPTDVIFDLTLTYKRNKPKYTGTWAVQVKNLLGNPSEFGYQYNLKTKSVEETSFAIIIPSISYKVEF